MKENEKYLEAPKAPEELIEKTLNRIHGKSEKSRNGKYVFGSGFAIACVLMLIFVDPIWSYPELQIASLRSGTQIEEMTEISIEEYEKYLGLKISEHLKEYQIKKVQCDVMKEQDEIKGDEAIYYFDVDGKTAVLKVSKTRRVTPDDLQKGKVVHLDEEEIYIARIEGTEQLVAGFQIEEINCYLIGDEMSLNQFKKIIKNILEK